MTTSIAGVTLATLLNIESEFKSDEAKRRHFCDAARRHVGMSRYKQIVNTALDMHEAEMREIDAVTTNRLLRMRALAVEARERRAGR